MPGLEDRYFAQSTFHKELLLLSSETAFSEEIALTVPDCVAKLLVEEAFYCQASELEMPSRSVLYGSVVMARLEKESPVCFETVGSFNGRVARARHLPFMFPELKETEEIEAMAESVQRTSRGETEAHLSPFASGLLKNHSTKNGLSEATNFLALANLVHYIGVNERAGNYLSLPSVSEYETAS